MDQDSPRLDVYARAGRERAEALTKALGEAARRARLSKRNKRALGASFKTGRGEKAFNRFRRLTFCFLFLLPSLAVGVYYFGFASDQYTTEARFLLRGGKPPRLDTIGALTGLPPSLIAQDTQVVLDFIISRDMVERLVQSIGLRERYTRPSIDVVSRLRASAKAERLLTYWKSKVDYSVRSSSGIVTLTVRAFTPMDAVDIARAVLTACEDVVNVMNERIMQDTLAASELERQHAEANLVAARARLETTRKKEGVLSAEQTATALNGLILEVHKKLDEMQQDYDAQRAYVSGDAPQLRVLNLRINAARDEMEQLQARLTKPMHAGDATAASLSMSQLDLMNLENKIAEKVYAWSLLLLEHAHLAAESKLLHFDVFVRPEVAQEAQYPRRIQDIALFTVADLIAWWALVQTVAFARNRFTPRMRFVRQPAA